MRHVAALGASLLTLAAFIAVGQAQTVYVAPAAKTPGGVYAAPGSQNYGKSGTHSTYGNTTYGSDGSISTNYGNMTYSNNADGTGMICAHYGSQTFCNWRQTPKPLLPPSQQPVR